MSDDLQRQVAEMLAKLTAAVERGVVFAGDQIPPLVAEKILVGRILFTTYLLLGLVLIALGLRLTQRLWAWIGRQRGRQRNDEKHDASFDRWQQNDEEIDRISAGVVLSVVMLMPGVMVVLAYIKAVIMVWFTPRLYILEWLRGFLK